MDLELGGSNPFAYIVGEHARAVVAIQDLQREVNNLLSFRDHVLQALPHLKSRAGATTTVESSDAAVQSTVVDSGFSTDKASTSMGKSSSTSSGEISGSRWTTDDEIVQPVPTEDPPLGSSEDELLHLLEVIRQKGTRLKSQLQRAEVTEMGFATHKDSWPHSLPPTSDNRLNSYMIEPFGEVERLRLDRSYLLSRVSRAETEAAVSHSRLMDLHAQMMGLAAEKRLLDDTIHDSYTVIGSNPQGHGRIRQKNFSSVLLNGDAHVRPREEVVLPRVLKVPIKEKSEGAKRDSKTTVLLGKESKNEAMKTKEETQDFAGVKKVDSGRLVIERQRSCNKSDGGLSMPANLMRSKIRVNPDKQRISAILREKDVLALRKQLLTTVMETEVLKRQLQVCNDEWTAKSSQFEEKQTKNSDVISALTLENATLRNELEKLKNVLKINVGTQSRPLTESVCVGTSDLDESSIQESPNVKYDIVVHQDAPKRLEKPPRKRAISTQNSLTSRLPSSDSNYVSKPQSGNSSLLGRLSVPLENRASTPVGTSLHIARAATPIGSGVSRVGTPVDSSLANDLRKSSKTLSNTPRSSPASSLTRHSRSTCTIRPKSGAPVQSRSSNKVPYVSSMNDSLKRTFGSSGQDTRKTWTGIPKAIDYRLISPPASRHLPQTPKYQSTKYLPIDSKLNINQPSKVSCIPSLVRARDSGNYDVRATWTDEMKKSGLWSGEQNKSGVWKDDVEQDRSTSSVECSGVRSTEKTLWRKSSGAIRIRNGRPSVLNLMKK